MKHDPMVPRSTDPHTSALGIEPNIRTRWERMVNLGEQLPQPFTDDMLHGLYEMLYERIDRGVVARVRLSCESKGYFERLPLKDDDERLQFRMKQS